MSTLNTIRILRSATTVWMLLQTRLSMAGRGVRYDAHGISVIVEKNYTLIAFAMFATLEWEEKL